MQDTLYPALCRRLRKEAPKPCEYDDIFGDGQIDDAIMVDLRADRFSPGGPIYNEDRWKAIMRTRALDNQVCMVLARNNVQGSCIIDRKGDILAWNEGDQEFTLATLPADDGYRYWDGGDFRETTFLLRRPHLYGGYTDPANLGPLGAPAASPGRQGTGGKR